MSVYKYDENTQTMREYDIAYQVQSGECLPPPNGIENLTLRNSKLNVDNTWLPYFGITDGTIRIGTPDGDGGGSRFWNSSVNTVYLETTDVPVKFWETGWTNLESIEQLHIDNTNARWGADVGADNAIRLYNTQYCSFIDKTHNVSSAITSNKYFPANANIINWVPNGTVRCGWLIGRTNIVLCGANIQPDNLDTANGMPLKIYHNADAILTAPFSEAGITCDIQLFEKEYTEWLNDYFIINQNGATLKWYEDTITNVGGKYVRLYNNNNIVGEIPYWKDDEITTNIGTNLTASDVTKTGTITYQGTTKSYSLTQEAAVRTIKARIYMNIVEQDGKTYNNFNVWPYGVTFGMCEGDPRQATAINSIKRIRYKKASDSQWSTMTLPTPQELLQRAEDLGYNCYGPFELYTLQLQESGYYDIEWCLIPDLPNNYDHNWYRICFTNNKVYYDYENHYLESKYNEDVYNSNTPWIVAFDAGGQYLGVIDRYRDDPIIREYDDWQCTLDSYSLSDGGQLWDVTSGGILTRQVKNIVLNNFHNESGWYNWVRIDSDTLNPDGLTVFYNNPTRERLDDTNWFMGVYPRCTKLYLHPTIYAMTNHGFDNTVPGWNDWQLDDFLNNGGQLYELPNNWRTLIPNYIGE